MISSSDLRNQYVIWNMNFIPSSSWNLLGVSKAIGNHERSIYLADAWIAWMNQAQFQLRDLISFQKPSSADFTVWHCAFCNEFLWNLIDDLIYDHPGIIHFGIHLFPFCFRLVSMIDKDARFWPLHKSVN